MIQVNVDTSRLTEKIRRLREITKKSLAATLRSEGRLLAVDLAKYTQPFGLNDSARAKGEAAIARDYDKVYPSAATAQSIDFLAKQVASFARPRDRVNAALRFTRYMQGGNTAAAEKMLRDMHVDFAYARTADPAVHAARWQRGKIRRGKTQVVLRRESVLKIVKTAQKKVGFAKSGWAECARRLGGVRGIPKWIHRGKCPGNVSVTYRSAGDITVTLVNEGNFTSQVLSQDGKRRAIQDRVNAISAQIDRIAKSGWKAASA